MIDVMFAVEMVAAASGLLCVYLTVKQDMRCWPTGLLMVFLYIFIFWSAKLYSDMILQVIYVFLQVYGWYNWRFGGARRSELGVSRLGRRSLAAWIAATIVGTLIWGYLMDNYTDADFAYYDAFTTVASLVAQWMLGKKILESWLFWISVDVVATLVYLMKGLMPTAVLYAIFLALAARGLTEWKATMGREA